MMRSALATPGLSLRCYSPGASRGDRDARRRHRAAAPRIAAAAELARRRVAGDRVDAAEEQVPLRPSGRPGSRGGEPVEPALVDAGLGLDGAGLEVDAGRLDGRLRVHAVGDQPDDRLQHRRADPVRAAAAEPRLQLAVARAPRSATSSTAPAGPAA